MAADPEEQRLRLRITSLATIVRDGRPDLSSKPSHGGSPRISQLYAMERLKVLAR